MMLPESWQYFTEILKNNVYPRFILNKCLSSTTSLFRIVVKNVLSIATLAILFVGLKKDYRMGAF
jgi:hypothetical protein